MRASARALSAASPYSPRASTSAGCGTCPVTAILGSRGGWDPGFNIGGGVGFKIGESSEFYIETRYHYVWGPSTPAATNLPAGITAPTGSANGSYWPLTFGFRF